MPDTYPVDEMYECERCHKMFHFTQLDEFNLCDKCTTSHIEQSSDNEADTNTETAEDSPGQS